MPSPFRRDHLEGQVTRLPTLTENRPNGGILPTDLVTVVTDPVTDPVIRQVPVAAFGSSVINVRSFGAVGDGVTDDTAAWNRMIAVLRTNGGGNVYVPRGDYIIGAHRIPSNVSIVLESGTILRDSGLLGASERLMAIRPLAPETLVENITIWGYGAKLVMNRSDYTTGEQRHGVLIVDAHNVAIYGLESSDTGGDGFYVGIGSEDVTLVDVRADNNRRQGMSIVSGKRIKVVRPVLTNTNGTAPEAGLDIEPNSPSEVLEDIRIIDPHCEGNAGCGILVFLANWNSTSNYADIVIERPFTKNNGFSANTSSRGGGIDLRRIPSTTPCRGRIIVADAQCTDEWLSGIRVVDWDENGPIVDIVRPTVINPNQSNGNSSDRNGGIILYNDGTRTTVPGNVRIVDPVIRDDDGLLNANSLNPLRIGGAWGNVEVQGLRVTYAGQNAIGTSTNVRFLVVSPVQPYEFQLTTSITLSDGRYVGRTMHNAGASGTITATLPAVTADIIGRLFTFQVRAAQQLRVDPSGSEVIGPGGTAGQYAVSSTIGATITLQAVSVGVWAIVSQSGTWTFA
jgi:hypothetical protein